MNPYGRPARIVINRLSDMERFIQPEPNSGCWLWIGASTSNGYGLYAPPAPAKTRQAHRESYQLLVGPIPDGLEIDHLCRVRSCVNPFHLEAVTHRENVIRGNPKSYARRTTHCAQGHLRIPGEDRCRECYRAWDRARGSRRRRAPSYRLRHAANQRAYLQRQRARLVANG